MKNPAPRSHLPTHEVFNQPEMPFRDPWAQDRVLRTALGESDALAALGAALGSADIREAAHDAQTSLPELRALDRGGRRLDEVHFLSLIHI